MKHLEHVIADIASGRAKLVEQDLIEVEQCGFSLILIDTIRLL